METGMQEHVAFYLTGRSPVEGLRAINELALRPALFAGYDDLTQLRYDFPLVLVDDSPADRTCVQSLSAIVDDVVQDIVREGDGDRLTQHALRLERHIRASLAAGASGHLSTLWHTASGELAAGGDDRLHDSLEQARAALKVDGEVLECGKTTPPQLFRHFWSTVERVRLARVRDEIVNLTLKLSDILQVDFANSEAGRSANSLKEAVGTVHADLFDFEVMSRLLNTASSAGSLSTRRRQRIERLLEVLRSQRFFEVPLDSGAYVDDVQPHSFVFHDCTSALTSYRRRLPEATELAKAITMARLEVETLYSEARHDALFAEFGASGLDTQEMARFPDYLVCVDAAQLHGAENDTLMEILSAGLPMNVLIQSDDILEESEFGGNTHLAVGSRARQLTSMAIGLNEIFVLQASNSHLYQYRDQILKGLTGAGPALFSVFSGAGGNTGDLPPYLIAAAAMESRAFPAFTYDPAAGDNWAERFSLIGNSQVEREWPVQRFAYEDENLQRVETDVAITLADFVACDQRFSGDFACVSQAAWNSSMVPIADYLSRDTKDIPEQIPCILMVDQENLLQKVIIDARLVRATKRCRNAWHSLQELGGIHNSHAERLLERERQAWEAQAQQATVDTVSPNGAEAESEVAAAAAEPAPDDGLAEPEPAPSPGDPYIETARCTTCHECIQINDKMFAYDENGQAYIVDPDAGTYRELVEAAENCQVAIIHPGKPRNPDEPGLDDVIKRAEAFQ
jgi:ferredoxin